MIDDTSVIWRWLDAADVFSIGVEWGYHGRARLHQARVMVSDKAALLSTLKKWLAR